MFKEQFVLIFCVQNAFFSDDISLTHTEALLAVLVWLEIIGQKKRYIHNTTQQYETALIK